MHVVEVTCAVGASRTAEVTDLALTNPALADAAYSGERADPGECAGPGGYAGPGERTGLPALRATMASIDTKQIISVTNLTY